MPWRKNSREPDPTGRIDRDLQLLNFPGIHLLPPCRRQPGFATLARAFLPNTASDFEVQVYRKEKGRILFDPVVIAVVRNLLEKDFELGLDLPPCTFFLPVFQ